MAVQLTPYEQTRVNHARQVLAASVIDSDHTRYPYHLGAMEVVLDNMLRLVDQLTGEGSDQ